MLKQLKRIVSIQFLLLLAVMFFPIIAKADSTYGYPDITFPSTYHITDNLYRSYKANGALMTTTSFPLTKDGEYAYQIYYNVDHLTGPVTIYLADTSGNNVLTLYSSGGAGGAEISKSGTVEIPKSIIGKTVTFNVQETYAASYWTDFNHDIYTPTVYYKTKPVGASIPTSGKIQMNSQSGSYSQNASYATHNGTGLWTQVDTYSTVAYDLSQITTITYSGAYSNVSVSGGTLSQNSTSCTLWLIDADTSDELFSATLNTDKSEGTVDLSGANQTKDLSNVIIKMRAISGGYSSKGTVYCYSTLPQYIEVKGNRIPIFSGNLTTLPGSDLTTVFDLFGDQ